MKPTEEDKTPKGDGTDFINQQSEIDKAKNERIRSNQRSGRSRNRERNKDDVTIKTDVSQKKTGGGKQVSPGT